jgi:hypothetical protein
MVSLGALDAVVARGGSDGLPRQAVRALNGALPHKG